MIWSLHSGSSRGNCALGMNLRVISGSSLGDKLNVRSKKEGLGKYPAWVPARTLSCNICQHCECRVLGQSDSLLHMCSGKATLPSSLSEVFTSSISPSFLKNTPQIDYISALSYLMHL